MPAPVYAFGFDRARQVGAPELLSEGGKAGHDEPVGDRQKQTERAARPV
jgi:hypothetical protein